MVTTLGGSQTDTEKRLEADAKNLEAVWDARNKRIQAWYTLRRLIDRWKQPGKLSFVSNRPKVFFNLARYMLAANPPRVTALMGHETEETKDKKGITERGVLSNFRQLDEGQWRTGRLRWREELADQILMGWVNVFYGVFRREDGSPDFRADIWDNLTVYPEWDDRGLATVVHKYAVSPAAAIAKARRFDADLNLTRRGGSSSKNGVEIVDWYHRDGSDVVHAMTINGQEIIPFEVVDGMDEITVLSLPINGEAVRNTMVFDRDPTVYICASILDTLERTAGDYNELMSIIKTNARDKAFPNYIDYTEDGQGFIDWQRIREGGGVHHGLITDKAEAIEIPDLPREAFQMVASLDREMAIASVSDAAIGDVAADTSGFLFSQLRQAALTNVGPYKEAQDFVLRTIAQAWAEGFRDGGFAPIKIRARTKADATSSGFYFEDWAPDDVDPEVWVDVTTDLAMERNRFQELNLLRQVLPTSQNILDETTALDEIAGFQDPQLIQERKTMDMVRNAPENLIVEQIKHQRQMIDLAKRRGDRSEVQARRIVLNGLLARAGLPPEGQQGQQQGGGGALPSMGAPPEAAGVMGRNGQSPDAMRALLGMGAPQQGRTLR